MNPSKILSTGESSVSSDSFARNKQSESASPSSISSNNENVTTAPNDKNLLFFAVYYGAPTFKITYAFNPPDDVREEDIIHECYIHYDPEDHLKVGDALPILYFIERHHNGITIQPDSDGVFRQDKEAVTYECVTSMPFPFPLSDPIDARDILCCSLGK